MRFPVNRHRLWQVAVDAALIALAWIAAWYVRFDARPRYYDRYLEWDVVLGVVVITLPVFVAFGFYNRWWRYVSTQDMWGVLRGVATAVVAVFLVFALLDFHRASVPRGIWIIDLLLLLAFVMGVRLLARTIIERPAARSIVARGKEVLIVGAGDAAQLMLREMLRNPSLGYTPIGLVDDDPRKKNLRLHGVRVLGTTAELRELVRERRPDELLIAIPSASGDVRERIVEVARVENVPVNTLPALHELITGDFNLAGQIRPVEVEDLLGREPVDADLASIAGYLSDEVVLVTGAGGSIGSELCRQIARMGPTRLVLVDNGEPGLFEIERELVDERDFHATAAVLADAGNATKMRQVFEKYRPAVVFHAAAYKHVPLMEANPLEAVRNNTLVTRTVADIAVEFGAKRFVLVSTDKAVNAEDGHGPVEGALRVDRRVVGPSRRHDDEVLRRALRERARLFGQRHPDLPQADRARWAGDGHARGDDALLHDDPGSRAADHPGRRDRRPRPGVRPRHGRAGEDHRSRRHDDPALGQGARAGHRDRVRRRAARREAARGALVGGPRTSHPRRTRRSCS